MYTIIYKFMVSMIFYFFKNKSLMLTKAAIIWCGYVCFFIRFGEIQHYITFSAMDALQWMGAVRMRVQTADKTSQ